MRIRIEEKLLIKMLRNIFVAPETKYYIVNYFGNVLESKYKGFNKTRFMEQCGVK